MISLAKKYPNIAFGTSGVRALVTELTFAVIYDYVNAFLKRFSLENQLKPKVVLGIDLRPSSPAIAQYVYTVCKAQGFSIEFIGALPTPALAYHCQITKSLGIMITGSHIPYDRNGIKFYHSKGEITKADEQSITSMYVNCQVQVLSNALCPMPQPNMQASQNYVLRYLNYFGSQALSGLHIGLYEHSAVSRDILKHLLLALGARVKALGRSDDFIPIDTEAVSSEDKQKAKHWCEQYALDAVVSTDGDSDRPLVFDNEGQFISGDILGLMTANILGITHLAVPVSCNSIIEHTKGIHSVMRTKIGSPFVIEALETLKQKTKLAIAGFEANGGFILATNIGCLNALPTRDAFLPMISVLAFSKNQKSRLSVAAEPFMRRVTFSDRIKNIDRFKTQTFLDELAKLPTTQYPEFKKATPIKKIDLTDGLRIFYSDTDVIHWRLSGNAPELRCYTESTSHENAMHLCQTAIQVINELLNYSRNDD
jgi:phosphomannomutase